MTKCLGCGALLQDKDSNKIGYTTNIDNDLCVRCFRIKNYNEYKSVDTNNKDYLKILEGVNKTNDLVLLVVDIFDIPANLASIRDYISNDLVLVINKRDILPASIYDVNLINYFKKYNLNEKDTVLISSKKNTNLDYLYEVINKYKLSSNVYVVGYTNAGKSTLINKLIYHYSDNESKITVSNMPSTTIDTISVKLNDELTLIDTPGLLNEDSIINKIDYKELKNIIPTKEIKPRVYQVKCEQYLLINKYICLNLATANDLVFYIANNLEVKRLFKEPNHNLSKSMTLQVPANSDIVLVGLGFIKVVKDSVININVNDNIEVYVRDSMI